MDRSTIYTQEQCRSVDVLFAQRAAMIGLAKMAEAAFGNGTVVRGLPVTPNSPAALNVLVGIGDIYTVEEVDATDWGALPADTTDLIVKQGLNMAAQTIATPVPVTGGFSIAYLIEAQYQDQDNVPVVLPFYNSANPQQPLNGQGGLGAAQPTQRQGVCVIKAKAGIAAATGTQVAPSVDSGWTALAVVTVTHGATTVVAGNISIPAGVPQITNLLQMMQDGSTSYAVDTSSTANQIAIAMTPALTAYVDGQPLNFRAANNNTGAVTINAGAGSIALSGAVGALQGGEIVAGKPYRAVYQANTGTAVLVGQGGGALQTAPATQPNQAVQLGQVSGVVGQARNLVMSIATASASATLTADEIIVETALGGLRYCLASFNKTINLATTGAGGMDTGTAPVSGFVALYAIYNPTTQTAALLATNATSAVQSNVYGGANMPSGYTASALISVWSTNASSQFIIGTQIDRRIGIPAVSVLSTATAIGTLTSLSIAAAVPKNAKKIAGILSAFVGTNQTTTALVISPQSIFAGTQEATGLFTSGLGSSSNFDMLLATPQTLFYTTSLGAGTGGLWTILISSYEI